MITVMMESVMDKRRILEIYLNVIEWGDGVFGAEAAARHYFGTGASTLTPAQAARLAAIVPTIASRPEDLVQQVRERYAKIAEGTLSGCSGAGGSCCGPVESAVAVGIGYAEQDLSASPDGSNLGLGCGAPITHLELRPGETVLDLGSGPGLDCFLAARAVGPQGRVIGVDMTPEMVGRARANAERAGLGTVEFRLGRLEALPVEDASVDAVTSNCVINLVPDKAAVFREVARVLKPGGRLVVSDIVLERSLPEAVSRDLLAYVGIHWATEEHQACAVDESGSPLDEVVIPHSGEGLSRLTRWLLRTSRGRAGRPGPSR